MRATLTVDFPNDAHGGGHLEIRKSQRQRVRMELSWPTGSQLTLRGHFSRCRRQFEAASLLLKNQVNRDDKSII